MYSPFKPNAYITCKYERYRKRRREEEVTAEARRREREETGNALADALASASAPHTLTSSHFGRDDTATSVPSSVSLSAEDLHRMRLKESAALGIRRAVEMENESLLLAQKTRKQQGTDTRSKISGLLERMRKRADATALPPGGPDAAPSQSVPVETRMSISPVTASPNTAPSTTDSASLSTTAPLVFKRSGLAAGGYVLSADPEQSPAKPKGALRGKPSSTLLIRFNTVQSPLAAAYAQCGPAATKAELQAALGPLLERVRQYCGRSGVVRSVRVHVTSPAELAAKAAAVPDTVADRDACLEKEKLRVFVRLDTVAEAFKAAETIAAVQPHGDDAADSVGSWSAVFFPSLLYDDGELSPIESEGYC